MSHDQKPARMRLTGGGRAPAAMPERRRDDAATIDNATAGAGTARGAAARRAGARSAVAPNTRGGRMSAALCVLFMFGCIAGGVALPLMGWI